jgi:hypothetical protein
MPNLLETLHHFDTALHQTAPKIADRLQSGLKRAEIEAKTAAFAWKFPQDADDLYQWHNGLSGQPGKLNLVEKLLRLKGKWHGELSGRENEIHLQFGDSPETFHERLITIKFLPLDYALAGHRHLKLGRCPIDLLPFGILSDGNFTIYCMMRLDPERPIIYCANGTNLPPMNVTESFLATQPQFSQLRLFIAFLTDIFQQGMQTHSTNSGELTENIDCVINAMQFNQLYQQQKARV